MDGCAVTRLSMFLAAVHRRPYAERYAADQAAFFSDYQTSHQKLSELGVQWAEGAPVSLD
jgi:hypothetical protein